MKTKYVLMAAFALPIALSFTLSVSSCCDNDSDIDSTIIIPPVEAIDNSYTPTQSYLQKTWAGEYTGWDAIQKANTTIRRKLVLSPNGNYTNIISGKIIGSDKEGFHKFESEAGTYTYNSSTRTITYTCRYDSVLNYREESYTVYNKKKYYDHEELTYTEKADFSAPKNGTRLWITKDTYLQSLTAEKLDIAFSMSVYAGDGKEDQNQEQK